MAFVRPKDRVLETSTTSGTGPWTLAGAVGASHNAFSASMSNGDTTLGAVVEPGVAFATGILTFNTAPNRVTLTTTYETKGTFGAGTKEIIMGTAASRDVYRNGDQTIDGALSVGGGVIAAGNGGFGPGGTGSTSGVVVVEGPSGTNAGALVTLRRNGVTTHQIGNSSGIDGGTSDDLVIYANGAAAQRVLALAASALSVIFSWSVLTPPSTNARAGFRVPTGIAPGAPFDGDIWNDGTDVKARVGGTTRTLTQLAPTVQVLTSGSGATYTTPAGVKWIEVKVVGAGGGGGGGQSAGVGGVGGNSVFNTTTVGGGGGGGTLGAGGGGGVGAGGYSNSVGQNGGNGTIPGISANAIGGNGGNSGAFGGGGGGSIGSATGTAGAANSGGGGGGGGATNNTLTGSGGGGGGSGGMALVIINNPASTYTYTVGGGGGGASGGSSSTSAGGTGGGGGSGRIEVTEHYG